MLPSILSGISPKARVSPVSCCSPCARRRTGITPRWRPFERAFPAVALLLALLLAIAYINFFGHPAEAFFRAGTFSGFAVAPLRSFCCSCAAREQQPPDYQRLRWVIWGCLIGLPTLTLADLGQQTTPPRRNLGRRAGARRVWNPFRLVNGVLCLFVFEAVRRPLVVNVTIPLRRVTILSFLLSAPALFRTTNTSMSAKACARA